MRKKLELITDNFILTRIPSGESIWGSRSKKDRLLNTNEGKNVKK
jgi:hypothetical protein